MRISPREIAVRKQAEEAMRASEEKYRTILEEMQDVYCEIDLKGMVTFINPATCAITGYSRRNSSARISGGSRRPPRLNGIAHYFQEIFDDRPAGKTP